MIDRIIQFSIKNKLIISILIAGLILWGINSLQHLPIDAVPDITNNQVQVITNSPDLSAQEVERLITYPLELALANIPKVEGIRSISRFGLSLITIVFEPKADIYWAREQINQKIQSVRGQIPDELGRPEMGPISTGLGEIYQYVIHPAEGYEDKYDPIELRSIQDWQIKRQLSGIPGVVEVNSSGGYMKQYEITMSQSKLKAFNISMSEVYEAVANNNENVGGSYIEKANQTYFIRTEGLTRTIDDLQNVVVKNHNNLPILLKEVADVNIGHAPRFGAMTMNGQGEVVGGQVMMLKGANSMEVINRVKLQIEQIKKSLPEGIVLEPYLDRAKLVNKTTRTVAKNLIEGALIVIFILVLLLGNFRAGLIVASVIPLSLLFAVSMMRVFGVSANLMSLGALDFGLVVDGAVIVVEAILHHLGQKNKGTQLSAAEQEEEVYQAATKIRSSAAFGEIIILIVYLPILFLQGVEGKMFIPMAQTVSFAIFGALILSLTYVPMMSAQFLKGSKEETNSLSQKIIGGIYKLYKPILVLSLKLKSLVLGSTLMVLIGSIWIFSQMGGEFIPTLEEGDFALHQILPNGSSIKKGVEVSAHLQNILMEKFPEVEKVVTKIGTAEIPTDVMPLEAGDIYVIMKPKEEWTSASTRQEMFEKMEEELNKFPGVMYEFTQPIQMRFNELMTGVRQDIAIKIYGEDLGLLVQKAQEAESLLNEIEGVGDIQVEPTAGLQQMVIRFDRAKIASYGISIAQINDVIKTAFAGKKIGTFYEGDRNFDIVARLGSDERQNLESLRKLYINLPKGGFVPLLEFAQVGFEEGPSQISRDNTQRRITIGVNSRNIDIATLVNRIKVSFDENLVLPAGYYTSFGGQFENLERAKKRLYQVVPIALFLIFILLYLTFRSIAESILIFSAIPLSAIGGIWALYLRGIPFSISAGVGFIALFGVAVLNGIVLIAYFNQLQNEGMTDTNKIIMQGTKVRLRPVVMTALVASLGFLPMALSTTAGAEVQRPLATVVIGGLITATLLTLIILPILYNIFLNRKWIGKTLPLLFILTMSHTAINAQVDLRFATEEAFRQSALMDITGNKLEAFNHLANNPLAPKPLSLSISGEEFDFGNNSGIHSIGAIKSFQNPKSEKAWKNLYETQKSQVTNRLEFEKAKLQKAVADEYIELSFLKSNLSLNQEMLERYQNFLSLNIKRQELGEDSGLPVMQNELLIQRIKSMSSKDLIDLESSLTDFQKWYPQSDLVEPFILTDMSYDVESMSQSDQTIINNYELQKNLIDKKQEIVIANNALTWNAGAKIQSANGDIPLWGYSVGVNLPLSSKYSTSRSQAAQLNNEALNEEKSWIMNMYSSRRIKLENNMLSQLQLIRQYETIIIPDAQNIIDMSNKSFIGGQSNFRDIQLAHENYYTVRKEHLQSIKEYWLTYNTLTYLITEF